MIEKKIYFHHKWNKAWLLVIIYNIDEFPHKLPEDLTLRILRSYKKLTKSQNIIEL